VAISLIYITCAIIEWFKFVTLIVFDPGICYNLLVSILSLKLVAMNSRHASAYFDAAVDEHVIF